MTFRKHPRGQVHFDVKWIEFTRFQIARIRHRFALSAIQAGSRNLRYRPVRCYIGKPREPVRQWRARGSTKERMRSPENPLFAFEGFGIVNETECIHGPWIT